MAMTGPTYRERIERARQRSDAGVGLAGVIVAIVLLAIGVTSISQVLTQSLAMQTMSAQRTVALSIAQAEMEQIRAMDPTTVVAVAAARVNENGNADVNGLYTVETTVTNINANIIEVTVIVTAPRLSDTEIVTWIYDGAI